MNAIQLFKLDQEVRLAAMRAATHRFEGLDQDAKALVSELLNAGEQGTVLDAVKDSMFEIYGIPKMLRDMGFTVVVLPVKHNAPGPSRVYVSTNDSFLSDLLKYQQMLDLGLRTENPLWT